MMSCVYDLPFYNIWLSCAKTMCVNWH